MQRWLMPIAGVNGLSDQKILLAGHSHLQVLGCDRWASPNAPPAINPAKDDRFLCLSNSNDDAFIDTIVSCSKEYTIALVWSGSSHLVKYLFKQGKGIDFVLGSNPELSIEGDAELVPEAVVRASLFQHAMKLDVLLPALKAANAKSVFVCGTPPPKKDHHFIRNVGLQHAFWQQRAKSYAVDVSKAQLSPPGLLHKTWALVQDMNKEMAEENGFKFIPVPASLQTADGFLLPEHYGSDIVHAYGDYGPIMLQHIYDRITKISGENQ